MLERAIASLVNVVNSIDSFEKALLGDIKRLRAGIGQVRTAALTLRNTISSVQTNALFINRARTCSRARHTPRARASPRPELQTRG